MQREDENDPQELTRKEQMSQLLGETARAWRFALDRRLAPLGLSRSQWLVLFHAGRAASPLTQTELAQRVGVEGPTLVGLLDRMEREGWIERRPDPSDRRCKVVCLTGKACDIRHRIEDAASRLREELLDGLPEQDLDRIIDILAQIKQRALDSR